MARRDLTVEDVERMGREEPGSAARYLAERREELEAEKQEARERDDYARFEEAFVAEGGTKAAAKASYERLRNERAEASARAAEEAGTVHERRRISQAL